MKKTLYILLLTIGTLQAQYTLIPDASFESILVWDGYDDVVDGRVLTANIENITELEITSEFITSLEGIQDFTALEYLNAGNNSLTSLDLTQNTNLIYLNLNDNELVSLDLTGNPNLEYVYCTHQQHLDEFYLKSIDVSQCYSLIHLDLENNSILENFDISNSSNLIYLNIVGANVTEINLSNNLLLEHLDISTTDIEQIDLSNNLALKDLELGISKISSLDLSNNINLEYFLMISINYNFIQLDISNNINLKFFRFNQAQDFPIDVNLGISDIDFSNNKALEKLVLSQCNVKTVNLNNSPNFLDVDLFWMYQIETLNLRNGNNNNFEEVSVQQYPLTPDLLTCVEVDNPEDALAGLPPYTPDVWRGNFFSRFVPSENCSTLNQGDYVQNFEVKIYPNPSSKYIYIKSDNINIVNITVYNQLGSIVKKVKNTKSMDISNLTKGIYFLKIETKKNNIITKQFIKN